MTAYVHEKPIRNFTSVLKLDKRNRSFTIKQSEKYKQRVLKIMEHPREDNKHTSILSPDHISILWTTCNSTTTDNKWKLHLTESYDGGTVFEFKLNT